MEIRLYKTLSDPKDVDKVLTAEIKIEDVNVKSDCSLLEPHFLISKSDRAFFIGYNYVYVPDFKRYYFLGSPVFYPGGYVLLPCKIDALMSFRGGIRGLNALVERQENIYNPYIADSYIKVSQGMKIKAVDNGLVGDETYSTYITTIGG